MTNLAAAINQYTTPALRLEIEHFLELDTEVSLAQAYVDACDYLEEFGSNRSTNKAIRQIDIATGFAEFITDDQYENITVRGKAKLYPKLNGKRISYVMTNDKFIEMMEEKC